MPESEGAVPESKAAQPDKPDSEGTGTVTPDGAGTASTDGVAGTGDEEELERLRAEVAELRDRE